MKEALVPSLSWSISAEDFFGLSDSRVSSIYCLVKKQGRLVVQSHQLYRLGVKNGVNVQRAKSMKMHAARGDCMRCIQKDADVSLMATDVLMQELSSDFELRIRLCLQDQVSARSQGDASSAIGPGQSCCNPCDFV